MPFNTETQFLQLTSNLDDRRSHATIIPEPNVKDSENFKIHLKQTYFIFSPVTTVFLTIWKQMLILPDGETALTFYRSYSFSKPPL
jgi:hypothetical protein